jgi:hypothetical protein
VNLEDRIKNIEAFKEKLQTWAKTRDVKLREWLNQNMHAIRRETLEAHTYRTVTISPPPAIGGLVMHNVDPFESMFGSPYGLSVIPTIADMLDRTIGMLRNPPPETGEPAAAQVDTEVQRGYAFVAMPMDENDPDLVDVLEAIKAGANQVSVSAERVDDEESNERVTNRIMESMRKAEFVIVDLTHGRPNVFFEAGYAHGIGKTPIYVARSGTKLEFDVKDYPVIKFRNMKELREGITKRLLAISRRGED